MKILHTSDWHVGKVLKGRDRHDEHAAALGSIVRTARDEDVDVVRERLETLLHDEFHLHHTTLQVMATKLVQLEDRRR